MAKPVLVIVDGPMIIQSLPLEKEKCTIGRGNDCDLVLSGSGVSRQHCLIQKKTNNFYIQDLGSTNGTSVNGKIIKEKEIKPGDIIEISDYKIVFELRDPGITDTQVDIKGRETSRLEGIYHQIKERIDSGDLMQEFEQYHKMVKKSRRRLTDRVNQDSLTGIGNRGFFEKTINETIKAEKRFSLLMLDIDHFKKVNDKYGHQKGDEVLKAIAFLIRSSCRSSDIIARYGGEEFAIIFPDMDVATANSVAHDIHASIREKSSEITNVAVTVSIGIAAFPDHGNTQNDVVQAADKALYISKETGRNRVTVYEEKAKKK